MIERNKKMSDHEKVAKTRQGLLIEEDKEIENLIDRIEAKNQAWSDCYFYQQAQ